MINIIKIEWNNHECNGKISILKQILILEWDPTSPVKPGWMTYIAEISAVAVALS